MAEALDRLEYTNSQIRELIREYIHDQRDRKLMYRRLVDGIRIEKLAEEFELSPRQTWTIIKKNERILFSHIPVK